MVNNQVNAEGRYQMKATDQGRSSFCLMAPKMDFLA